MTAGSVELTATSIIEAMLFVGGPPLTASAIAELVRGIDPEQIAESIARLNQLYFRQNRPYEIRHEANGYRMHLRPQLTKLIQRLKPHHRKVRLSAAAIEVLSIVAYRQPLSAQEVEGLRGTDSAAILRQLKRRGLIDTIEHDSQTAGRTPLYGTTRRFMQVFQLNSLEDLPRVQDLE